MTTESPRPAPMLAVDQLDFAYGDLKVLWGMNLTVRQGEIVTLVGSNGAGKSTTLKNISRLLKWTSGRITFDEVSDAHRRLEAGGLEGKLVLCP